MRIPRRRNKSLRTRSIGGTAENQDLFSRLLVGQKREGQRDHDKAARENRIPLRLPSRVSAL
jgi:hypothetical protein